MHIQMYRQKSLKKHIFMSQSQIRITVRRRRIENARMLGTHN